VKAVICNAYGPPDVLRLAERPTPEPKRGQVRVKMRATAVTYSDCFVRGLVIKGPLHLLARLVIGIRRQRRDVLGIVVAGEVDRIGAGVTRFKEGDAVFGLDGWGARAWAEYKCMKADGVLASKPANLSWQDAAAIPYGGLLALHFLRTAGIAAGMRVLIYAASGATGSSAVQLAKQWGAHVTAVCSSGNVELVRSLGADAVIDYTRQDFTLTDERYDRIFVAVGRRYGPPSKDACRRALARSTAAPARPRARSPGCREDGSACPADAGWGCRRARTRPRGVRQRSRCAAGAAKQPRQPGSPERR
jgi:NADPH:quinone reductase-like Zn-dependent oxidoreductase